MQHTQFSVLSISKSTATRVSGSGWHSGISSLVRLAAWIAAMRATPLESFLSWVAAAPQRPFVAYLNFQATHYPYVVPPGEPDAPFVR